MWVVIFFLLVSLVIIFLEVPRLRRENHKKELFWFFILLILGISYNITFYTDGYNPDPFDWITAVIQPLSDKIMQLLK